MTSCRWIRPMLYACALAFAAGCTQKPSDASPKSAAPAMDDAGLAEGGESPAAELENTYWKLVRLGATLVSAEGEREPYLVLHSREKRVAGYGGCNRMLGAYELSGDRLTFSQIAGTMMACAEGMEHERAFHDALEKVSRWRIEGETLELLDASGVSLALFESRYLQ